MKILTMKNLEVTTFPSPARIFHLVVFLLLVIFQILLVWMISDVVRGSGQLGRRLRSSILVRSAATVRPHPRSVHVHPAHRPGGHVRHF